jgi:hypothetical protein
MRRYNRDLRLKRAQLLVPTLDEVEATAAAASAARAAESAAAFSTKGSGGPGRCTAPIDDAMEGCSVAWVERSEGCCGSPESVATCSEWDALVTSGRLVIQKYAMTATKSDASTSQPIPPTITRERVMFKGPHGATTCRMISPQRSHCKASLSRIKAKPRSTAMTASPRQGRVEIEVQEGNRNTWGH